MKKGEGKEEKGKKTRIRGYKKRKRRSLEKIGR